MNLPDSSRADDWPDGLAANHAGPNDETQAERDLWDATAPPDPGGAAWDAVGDAIADEFVYGRVARLLLDMSETVDGEKVVTKRLPKQDIAKMIGASREMVSRVMKDLQMGGYIEMRGSNIVLRDSIVLPE